ncbi:DUF3473 domain-containing protein [Geobacter pelophilus]|uniref:DUF3473 domain-containing protein n=1 Tax=Geoanaerobacter pelophilus TaxID=60036 RepID=A0AAW4KW06_9BACT|nr:XrtA system polysaccharide deacetylase [Geoanaerobacter pelophilus]MBT0662731.1 DUF3473 domain-containing protein [Geoanaerobacter pelophilus]
MLNALSIDVEDYFQVNAFARHVKREQWSQFQLRVAANTDLILEMLDDLSLKGTFFVLGWIAEREPELIKEIQRRGHEIACHGYGHELIFDIGLDRFREDVRRAKRIIEDLTGTQVNGYRAPSYSITYNSLWAINVLIEEGFTYDSSIFPVYHDTYGIPDSPRFPYLIKSASGTIREFPLTTYPLHIGGKVYHLPVAGGGYLRLLPTAFLSHAIRTINTKEGKPVVLYFHPWEIDPEQPRIKAGMKSRFRHYVNLDKTKAKLRSLLSTNKFGTMLQVLEHSTNLSEYSYGV